MSNNGSGNIYQQALKTKGHDVIIVQEQMMIGATTFPSAQMKRISPHFTEASAK